jgi:hypothetical protein
MMFLDWPACLDQEGAARCGLPAEVRCRFTMRSTDGPLDRIMIRCPAGHHFSGPVAFLTPDSTDNPDQGTGRASSRAGRDRPQRAHDGRGDGGSALRNHRAAPQRQDHRRNNTPAYYLGQPATVWITAMRARRSRTTSHHLMETGARGNNPTPETSMPQHS